MTIERIEIGDMVLCDLCNADWTNESQTGGMLVQSKAVCPACAPRYRADLVRYDEQHLIHAACPPWQSFADWCRELRGPNAAIEIRTGDDFEFPA